MRVPPINYIGCQLGAESVESFNLHMLPRGGLYYFWPLLHGVDGCHGMKMAKYRIPQLGMEMTKYTSTQHK